MTASTPIDATRMELGSLQLGSLQLGDEVIVSALAPESLLRQVLATAATPVFADVDARTGAITRSSLEAAITTSTRVVVLSEVGGYLPLWTGLYASTEPRQIHLISTRPLGDTPHAAKRIVSGLEAVGGDLLRLDAARLVSSGADFAADLRQAGLGARALSEEGLAFECQGLRRRYRRRDFPGAVAALDTLISLPGWDFHLPAIEAAAFAAYRQESFDFMQPLPAMRPLPRPVLSEGIVASALPATHRRAAGSRR
jgi:hypothetical protein